MEEAPALVAPADIPTANGGPTARPPERAGALPVTGNDILPLAIGGLVLLAMGAALRRRAHANT